MRIAFYAPMKTPDHPVPSGDRQVARLLFAALRLAGHEPFLASRLRSYDGTGEPRRQARIAGLGGKVAARLVRRWREHPEDAPRLWFTYHPYYKAPDHLGPAAAEALEIPYLIAEASHAPKRENGPWAIGHRAAARAIRRADAVIGLNPADRDAVMPLLHSAERWVALKPFLDADSFSVPERDHSGPARLIAVAMMRPGDKLASYRLLGAALAKLLHLPWSLEIVGDGPAREAVECALAALGNRVRFAGALAPAAIAARFAAADICLWPALNEAFGMALLEAQASGLPVVAGECGGVGEIVRDGVTGLLVPPGDAAAFAAAVENLLREPWRRARLGAAARRTILAEHDFRMAARRLRTVIDGLAR